MTAKDISQFLRGEMFITVDFLLNGSGYSKEDVEAIIDYFKAVLQLIA